MPGIFDGHNIEDRSTPLIKLEVDVVTLEQFNDFLDNYNNLEARVVALETDHPDLMAHLLAPISTAHTGYINVPTQIANASITTDKCAFVVLTLGTANNQAARGDHLHTGVYMPVGDAANFVTLNTAQTITGVKTFENAVYLNTQNVQTQDKFIRLNTDAVAAAGHFDAGYEIWNPMRAITERPSGSYVRCAYDSASNRFRHLLEENGGVYSIVGEFAYLSDVNAATSKPSGTERLKSNAGGTYAEITLPGTVPAGYEVQLSIKRAFGNTAADIGDIWYTKMPDNKFRVYNSGVNNYDYFNWVLNY